MLYYTDETTEKIMTLLTRSRQQLLDELEGEGPEDRESFIVGKMLDLSATGFNTSNKQWRTLIARKREELNDV